MNENLTKLVVETSGGLFMTNRMRDWLGVQGDVGNMIPVDTSQKNILKDLKAFTEKLQGMSPEKFEKAVRFALKEPNS